MINPDAELCGDRVEDRLTKHDGHGIPEEDMAVIDQSNPSGAGINLDCYSPYSSQFLRDDTWD